MKQEEAFYTKRHYKDKKFKSVHNEKLNPLDKNGKVSKCVICGSKMHRANKCPHRSEQNVNILEDDDDNLEEINIVLMTEKFSKTEIFVAKASKSAVIDTACTKTIAGEKWFTNFKSNLTDDSIKNIEIYQSNTKFKFGDGRQVTATKRVIFPIVIAGKHCRIEAEIVKENIPLLLSKTSLKRCNMIIDLPNDKAKVFDRDIDLQSTTSGHYCINILPDFNFDEKTEIVLILENELPNDKKRHQMMKIHKQFGHATADNILKLLNNANIHTSDISLLVKEVVRSCSTCKKFQKPSPRPVVGFSKADDFNQTVSVDLHELKSNLWCLHIVDEFTRYSAATLVNNKSLCAKAFIKTWISIFDAPQKIFSDNGGEFISDRFHMCERLNIKIQTSPSYSPWSNGLCERHNQTLTTTLLKIKEDTKCDFDTALAWAVCAKNSLINNNGFSPSQLVFGRNTNLPNFINNKLPAQETTCK